MSKFQKVKVFEDEYELTYKTKEVEERKGVKYKVQEKVDTVSLGNRLVSRELVPYMRSRNIGLQAEGLKPSSRFFAYFDGIRVTPWCMPKLLEIRMRRGTFIPGETVLGYNDVAKNKKRTSESRTTGSRMAFRLATANHKYGDYLNPEEVYEKNPYELNQDLPTSYSSSSTILNIDIESLSLKSESGFYGRAKEGTKLVGQTSGAVAIVRNNRLITDEVGTFIGTFFIPNPKPDWTPKFETGTKVLLLIDDNNNEFIPGEVKSQAEAEFTAAGELNVIQETRLSTRNSKIERIPASDTRVTNGIIKEVQEYTKTRSREEDFIRSETGKIIPLNAGDYSGVIARVAAQDEKFDKKISAKQAEVKELKKELKEKDANKKLITKEINQVQKEIKQVQTKKEKPRKCGYKDPIAQTFKIDEESGVFLTSIEVYFQSKDGQLPVTCQIRSVIAGNPTSEVLPLAEKTLKPKQVKISQDASVPTRFTFPSPIYLKGDTEYALVLQTDSSKYNAWISRMSEVDISTASGPDSQKILVSQQPYLGSLFKSQNGETWDPSQLEDLKFTLYTAKFNTEGGVFVLYNPNLNVGNNQIVTLRPNPIKTISREAIIKLGNNITTPISPGVTITQLNNTITTGKLVSTTGAIGIGSTLAIVLNNVGSGLTPSSGSFTYNNVELISLSGIGSDALAQITVTNGNIGVATVTTGGQGYKVGDLLSVKLGQLSQNVQYNVGIVSSFNTLLLDNVQGEFNLTDQIVYINAGTATTFAYSGAAPVPTNVVIDPLKDGLHFKVSHRNHGMHSRSNKVRLNEILPDDNPSLLIENYDATATTPIKVSSVGIFTSFESVSVSSTNPGYVLIDDEIISYTGVDAGSIPPTLTGIARGIDSSVATLHEVDDQVFKYELNNISLRRINKVHIMADTNPNLRVGLDEYYLKVDTASDGIVRDGSVANGFPILRFDKTADSGGNNVIATQNIQFEAITPNIQFITPPQTDISARVRTVSATSVGGNEESFVDKGFEQINLNQINYFKNPRLVASNINDEAYLKNLPGRKSVWLELILQSDNENVSPVVDLDRASMIFTTNRLDRPVTNFRVNPDVRRSSGDPHAAVYVSKKVQLENPATSLDVRFAAQRIESSEIRVMYKLFRSDTPDETQPYEFFPGYNKKDGTDNIGKSNTEITSDNDDQTYKDYSYGIDDLAPFNGFMIKIIMYGRNQAQPPLISDLSVIALA
jgi:hypothetical protein